MKVGNKQDDCYHGDEDASRGLRSVETGSHAKQRNSTHITPITDRPGFSQWPSSLVRAWPKKRRVQRHLQNDGPESTAYQT